MNTQKPDWVLGDNVNPKIKGKVHPKNMLISDVRSDK